MMSLICSSNKPISCSYKKQKQKYSLNWPLKLHKILLIGHCTNFFSFGLYTVVSFIKTCTLFQFFTIPSWVFSRRGIMVCIILSLTFWNFRPIITGQWIETQQWWCSCNSILIGAMAKRMVKTFQTWDDGALLGM